ncbi:MAG: hypothetical protein QNJ06_10365 [Kiloniellales bacterium]|nr:hypothetical protein [Kiloniellales bacterium]MDJ0980315.1 hypothetical protein [Kiloniellales bacterium]
MDSLSPLLAQAGVATIYIPWDRRLTEILADFVDPSQKEAA